MENQMQTIDASKTPQSQGVRLVSTADVLKGLAEAARFLKILDPTAKAFSFQTFDDKKQGRKELTRLVHGSLEALAPQLAELNAKGAGIFVTVNETNLCGRKNENIIRPRCVFQEADKPGGRLPPLDPHIEVETSSGKFHRYILLDESESPKWQEWSGVMARMVQDYDSDPSAKDRARVLRLPGFFHQKGEPFGFGLSMYQSIPATPGKKYLKPSPQWPALPP